MNTPPDAVSDAAQVRRQQHLEDLSAVALRAMVGDAQLHFHGRRLCRQGQPVAGDAPHLHPSAQVDGLASFRGAADGHALRLLRSDPELHALWRPEGELAALLFDMFEQFRAESQVPTQWPGVRRNLAQRFEDWTRHVVGAGLNDSMRGLLIFTVAQITHAHVTGLPILEGVEDAMESTRAGLSAQLGGALVAMKRARHRQADYAPVARELAETVAALYEDAAPSSVARRPGARLSAEHRRAMGLALPVDPRFEGDAAASGAGRAPAWALPLAAYRVYTREFDRERHPSLHIRPAELQALSQRLDKAVAEQGLNVARLARQVQAVLGRHEPDDWAHAQEAGVLDGRRLAQLVASPTERRLFREPALAPRMDVAVTVLIDCSGSMRTHIEALAVWVDVWCRALDMAGACTEVLGFTTGAWQGGRPFKAWQRAGRPASPGRLNEVDHLIFKAGDVPWRRARKDLAALLKADWFREGIDGEALQWAAQRLRLRPETRRVLLVISDGCPMDAATHGANEADFLDAHLRAVAGSLHAAQDLELCALGVGWDLSGYYTRSRAIDLAGGLSHRVFDEVLGLMQRAKPRQGRV